MLSALLIGGFIASLGLAIYSGARLGSWDEVFPVRWLLAGIGAAIVGPLFVMALALA